jgi:DNA-binding NarL/FixJ family response regulator
MKAKKKIITVEDHAIFREGLRRIISEMEDMELVGEAPNGVEFLKMLKKVTPDLVIMDIQMPEMDGIEATEKALQFNPSLKILVLSMFGEEEYIYTMVDKGIYGFILKNSDVADFKKAIMRVSEGQHYYSEEVMQVLVKKVRGYDTLDKITFTNKENEVLRYLCKGLSNAEISEKIFVSTRTVEGYRNKLLQKTGTSNVLNLVIFALRNKLVIL